MVVKIFLSSESLRFIQLLYYALRSRGNGNTALLCNDISILDTDSAKSGNYKFWFEGNHISCLDNIFDRGAITGSSLICIPTP